MISVFFGGVFLVFGVGDGESTSKTKVVGDFC